MKKTLYLTPLLVFLLAIPFAHADALSAGCVAGDEYSPTTGHLCAIPQRDCAPGDLYSAKTGQPCSTSAWLPGCHSTSGYSVITGDECDGSTAAGGETAQQQEVQPIAIQPSAPIPMNDSQPSDAPTITDVTDGYVAQVKAKYPDVRIESSGAVNLVSFTTFADGGVEVASMSTDGGTVDFEWLDGSN